MLAAGSCVALADLKPFSSAIETGKKEQKNIVVVWNGSDWSNRAPEVVKAFDKHAQSSKEKVVWAEFDDKGTLTEANQEYDKKNRPPIGVWNIPAIQVYTPDRQLLYTADGVTAKSLSSALSAIPKVLKVHEESQKLFQKAAETKDKKKALELYDEGLSMFPRDIAKTRRDILDKIRQLDPEDLNGLVMKHSNSQLGFIEKVNDLVFNKKTPDEAKKYIERCLKTPGLTKEERQKIMVGYFSIARGANDKAAALKALQDIHKVAPKTDTGQGALNYYNYLAKPVVMKDNKLTGYYLRPDFQPLILNVSDKVKSPGTYKIICQVSRGGGDFRNAKLVSGKRVLAELPADQKDKNMRNFTLTIADHNVPRNVSLVMEIKGYGWFDLEGEIVITQEF